MKTIFAVGNKVHLVDSEITIDNSIPVNKNNHIKAWYNKITKGKSKGMFGYFASKLKGARCEILKVYDKCYSGYPANMKGYDIIVTKYKLKIFHIDRRALKK